VPLLLLKYWKYVAAALLVAFLVFAWQKRYSNGFDDGVESESARWLAMNAKAVEEGRQEVERVKAEAQAKAEQDKAARERQYNEDSQRRDREQAQRDAKIADLRSLMQHSSPQCQEWRKQVFACKPE
jgi:hypothetical protein